MSIFNERLGSFDLNSSVIITIKLFINHKNSYKFNKSSATCEFVHTSGGTEDWCFAKLTKLKFKESKSTVLMSGKGKYGSDRAVKLLREHLKSQPEIFGVISMFG